MFPTLRLIAPGDALYSSIMERIYPRDRLDTDHWVQLVLDDSKPGLAVRESEFGPWIVGAYIEHDHMHALDGGEVVQRDAGVGELSEWAESFLDTRDSALRNG